MQALYRTVVVNRELSWKGKLSIYTSIYILTPDKRKKMDGQTIPMSEYS